MSQKTKQLAKDTCAHGYAGIASAFVALADRKLKPGGVLALVLPLTAAVGLSWLKFRQMLTADYSELQVLSIAANGKDMSFSSDTGISECLIVARKPERKETPPLVVQFTSLRARPGWFLQASEIAKNIVGSRSIRRLEDGPYGGTPLDVGEELVGEVICASGAGDNEAWAGVRLSDYSLAQTAYALADSKLWLPGVPTALDLEVVRLHAVGKRGMHDINIAGKSAGAPFVKANFSPTATYPALWNHDAKEETRIVCEPDSQVHVKTQLETKAASVWVTASRAHISRGFRFNSQPLAVAFTDQRSIGGRAWPNVGFSDFRWDYPFAIWSNSSLGLLSYWWHSNRQVAGRGEITVSAIDSLPVLDFRTLSDEQLATAQDIFDDFRERDLMPAYLADADPNRALLDRRVVCDLLGFDDATYRGVRRLAQKWCAEPSVHGGKARPKDATYVE